MAGLSVAIGAWVTAFMVSASVGEPMGAAFAFAAGATCAALTNIFMGDL